jgi:hypothetical protein
MPELVIIYNMLPNIDLRYRLLHKLLDISINPRIVLNQASKPPCLLLGKNSPKAFAMP